MTTPKMTIGGAVDELLAWGADAIFVSKMMPHVITLTVERRGWRLRQRLDMRFIQQSHVDEIAETIKLIKHQFSRIKECPQTSQP